MLGSGDGRRELNLERCQHKNLKDDGKVLYFEWGRELDFQNLQNYTLKLMILYVNYTMIKLMKIEKSMKVKFQILT